MWRDILIVLAFIIAILHYLGVTPRKISQYAKSAKAEVGKRRLHQKIIFLLGIGASLYVIFVFISKFEELPLEDTPLFISMLILLWCVILRDTWEISGRGERIVDIVIYLVFLPAFIAWLVLVDMPLWKKIVYPIGGVFIGYGSRTLFEYINSKLKKRRASKEETNK